VNATGTGDDRMRDDRMRDDRMRDDRMRDDQIRNDRIRIDVHLRPGDMRAALERDVRAGLAATPKDLPPKWFYDEVGCEFFDAITRLPEYYPTETERLILRTHAADIVASSGARSLVELGSGTSDKTRVLLDELCDDGEVGYVPFDVAESTLHDAAVRLCAAYPQLRVHGVVGDFDRHLSEIPPSPQGPRIVAMLGGTIGNYPPGPRATLLRAIAGLLGDDDSLLLGVDLVKDPARLVAAYDDASGVTASFNRNVLAVLNRELDADFDPALFAHRAVWSPEHEWIEMRLVATAPSKVHVAALDLSVAFEEGEEMRTEISAKFTAQRIDADLAEAGLVVREHWTDPAGDFAVVLAVRA
jgi:L-histidine N-alpha-methyltransferase